MATSLSVCFVLLLELTRFSKCLNIFDLTHVHHSGLAVNGKNRKGANALILAAQNGVYFPGLHSEKAEIVHMSG